MTASSDSESSNILVTLASGDFALHHGYPHGVAISRKCTMVGPMRDQNCWEGKKEEWMQHGKRGRKEGVMGLQIGVTGEGRKVRCPKSQSAPK
jgi:hypothetical protein